MHLLSHGQDLSRGPAQCFRHVCRLSNMRHMLSAGHGDDSQERQTEVQISTSLHCVVAAVMDMEFDDVPKWSPTTMRAELLKLTSDTFTSSVPAVTHVYTTSYECSDIGP